MSELPFDSWRVQRCRLTAVAAMLALSTAVWTGCGGGSSNPATPSPSPSTPTGRFDYPVGGPTGLVDAGIVRSNSAVEVHDITYNSPANGFVPAYLVVPKSGVGGSGLRAGLVYLHWGYGDRGEFLDEAMGMGERGAVAILIDGPQNRGGWSRSTCEPYIQTVLDLRRAADVLIARGDVDSARIGYVGHSFGATWGGVLAGVDKRFKAFVLVAGLAHAIESSGAPGCNDSSLDAVNFIGQAAPAALFFQFATTDEWVSRAEADAYVNAASQPKTASWYTINHEFKNAQADKDRFDFLCLQLGL